MITKEDMIKEGDLFFAKKEIDFLSEEIKYEENDIRYPYNGYIWSSAIQLNFKYKDEFYFVNISHRSSDNKIALRGWYKDYEGYKTIFDLPPSLFFSVLGHFTGHDKNGSYVNQPFRNDNFLSEDIKIIKILETIEEIIKQGEIK